LGGCCVFLRRLLAGGGTATRGWKATGSGLRVRGRESPARERVGGRGAVHASRLREIPSPRRGFKSYAATVRPTSARRPPPPRRPARQPVPRQTTAAPEQLLTPSPLSHPRHTQTALLLRFSLLRSLLRLLLRLRFVPLRLVLLRLLLLLFPDRMLLLRATAPHPVRMLPSATLPLAACSATCSGSSRTGFCCCCC